MFQSTLPMKGVTFHVQVGRVQIEFQSTLPMKGVTLYGLAQFVPELVFQSTLPMKGVTSGSFEKAKIKMFQSTLPMKGVTASAHRTYYPTSRFNPHSQ